MKLTVREVTELGALLRRAVDEHDVDAAFEVCRRIDGVRSDDEDQLDELRRLIVKEEAPELRIIPGGKAPL